MKLRVLLATLAIGLTAALSTAQTTATAPATKPATTVADAVVDDPVMTEIARIRIGIVTALNKGDIDATLTYLHPEIIVTWANAEVSHGPKEVKEYCDRMLKGSGKMVETITVDPKIEGRRFYGENVLISYGTLGDTFKLTDGKDFTLNSRFSSLLVRENGKWLMKGFHASANVFDNPVQTIVVKKVALWTGIGAAVVGIVIGFILGKATGKKPARA